MLLAEQSVGGVSDKNFEICLNIGFFVGPRCYSTVKDEKETVNSFLVLWMQLRVDAEMGEQVESKEAKSVRS